MVSRRLRRYSVADDGLTNREASDRCIRQAINHLQCEGGSGPSTIHVDRVRETDEGIVQRYRKGNYPYDSQLRPNLPPLAEEVQSDFQCVEESPIDLAGNNHNPTESANSPDPIVGTSIPCHATESNLTQSDVYDSGPHSNPPNVTACIWNQIKKVAGYFPFTNVAGVLNQGGVCHAEKEYAPKVALPQLGASTTRMSQSTSVGMEKSIKAKGKEPIYCPSISPTIAGPSNLRTPGKTSRIGTINPEVLSQTFNHPQNALAYDTEFSIEGRPFTPLPVLPKPIPKTPKLTLKKFDQRRAAVSKPVVDPGSVRIRTARIHTPSISDSITDESVTHRLSNVTARPPTKREIGRTPKSVGMLHTQTPPYAKSLKAKRKLDGVDNSYTRATKKSKKSVEFADMMMCRVPTPMAKKEVAAKTSIPRILGTKAANTKATSKLSGVKETAQNRRASREVLPAPRHFTVSRRPAAGYESMKRGITRSGKKFKGKV